MGISLGKGFKIHGNLLNIPKCHFLIVSLVNSNFMLVHWPVSKPLGTLHTRKRIQLGVNGFAVCSGCEQEERFP